MRRGGVENVPFVSRAATLSIMQYTEEEILRAYPRYRWTADDCVKGINLEGKHVVLTGATNGLGVPTAAALARTKCHLLITARDSTRGKAMADQVAKESGNSNISVADLDISSLKSVAGFVEKMKGTTIDVLVLNAGTFNESRCLTADGFENTFQVNVLSVVFMCEALMPMMAQNGGRIVVVSSAAHRRLAGAGSFVDKFTAFVESKEDQEYNPFLTYGMSKSCATMYCNALAARLKENNIGVTVNSLHPGVIVTNLPIDFQTIFKLQEDDGWLKTVEQGASTTVWAAVAKELDGISGAYLENCEVADPTNYTDPIMTLDSKMPLVVRLAGTAPHVWDSEACAHVDQVCRKILAEKGLLEV